MHAGVGRAAVKVWRVQVGFSVKVTGRISQGVAAALIGVLLSGCATSLMDGLWGDDSASSSATASSAAAVAPDMAAAQETATVAKLYNAALADLNGGSLKSALKQFGEVERQYPYSSYATQAILMQAYIAYKLAKWDDAVNAANRYITLHPGGKDVGYAYYLVAVCNYDQIGNTKLDQSSTKKALEALQEVAQRFPGTPYAADATRKVLVARDHLAGKEMEVGRYYYRQGAYLAGINRFKTVVTDYRNTSQTPEALYRLTEGYMALGVVSEAQTAAAVLGTNYPQSQWYRDAYTLVSNDGVMPEASKESWISKAFDAVNPL
ncbi:MAG: outer membrane protein assembly factor BamD [Aestuariivirga sp.]|uniref:outer membrane protein assembly factor BamD n=1 Tax=Aestuariivirga sp. TaxID=2650926 RepID=UPI0025BA4488|nr:outer membrane protein assembly factor BamD [Aestuariivirga sp.]MCA3560412.1 outer membrane protein assembly factor BamD [Aestuariivirga sp.]